MRKLLLASVALLGISSAIDPAAYAQMSVQYGDNSGDDSGQGAPAPGTITVRLNGKFQFFVGAYSQGDMNSTYYYDQITGTMSEHPFVITPNGSAVSAGVTAGPTGAVILPTAANGIAGSPTFGAFVPAGTAGSVPVLPGSIRAATFVAAKVQSYGMVDWIRLYPGFDGVAANGLKYGVNVEIRSSDIGGAGGGVYGSPSNVSRVRDTLQFRRAYGYAGTDQLGTLRFGMGDGPINLLFVGGIENFNSGGWNGSIPASMQNAFSSIWPFIDGIGSEYDTNKLVYLSPQVYGFDFGVSYEPDTSGLNGDNQEGCESAALNQNLIAGASDSVAGIGCDMLSSISGGSDLRRRRNTIEAALRYRATFGPVGFAASAGYIGSQKVNYSGPGPGVAQTGGVQQYHPLSVGQGGAQVTYAGFTVGVAGVGGNMNNIDNNIALQPTGTKAETAYQIGASYTTGPLVVGAHYFNSWAAGAQTAANSVAATGAIGRYNAKGVAAGGTYSVAPGLAVYLEYLWGQIQQNGQNLDLGVAGVAHNTINTQYLGVGTQLSW